MPIISKITGAPFRFWCQKVLPAVYDDSLSYYELLCKVVDYLNKVMEDDINVINLVNQLEEFVNDYFTNLDVQEEINNKLDSMAEDGSLSDAVEPYLDTMIDAYKTELDADLAEYKENMNEEVDSFKTSVNNQLTVMNNNIDEQDNDIAVLQSQMDNFIADHTGDDYPQGAEVLDIRVGYNGTTYDNAGTAVRTQVRNLHDEVDSFYVDTNVQFPLENWFQGGISITAGENTVGANRCRCNSYTPAQCAYIKVKTVAGYKFSIRRYDLNSVYLGYTDWLTETNFAYNPAEKYRFVLARTDDSALPVESLTGEELVVTEESRTDKSLTLTEYPADAKVTGDLYREHSEPTYNLFYPTKKTQTYAGVTYVENDDGSITLNGTATTSLYIYLMGAEATTDNNIPAGSYYINREMVSGEASKNPYFSYRDDNSSALKVVSINRITTLGTNARLYLQILTGYTYNNATYKFIVAESKNAVTMVKHGRTAVDTMARIMAGQKLGRTGKNEFFTVAVDRPLPFGSEEVPSETQNIECVLRLPESYNPYGKPTRLVLTCHGSGGYINSASNYWWHANWNSFVDSLVNAGYACFDANLYPTEEGNADVVGQANGSPLYVQNLKKAYDYIVENYNVYPQIFVHGCSMGGVGASAFAHVYSNIVLAESSFAGRDICLYLYRMIHSYTSAEKLEFARSMGYTNYNELVNDKFSHIVGYYPSLSLVKVTNGTMEIPPDRETEFDQWIAYYAQPESYDRDDDTGIWIGKREVPYKAWNSWGDRIGDTKAEELFAKAYNTGASCVYYNVMYESDNHTQMCYGLYHDMNAQLLAWYKSFE